MTHYDDRACDGRSEGTYARAHEVRRERLRRKYESCGDGEDGGANKANRRK